MAQEIPGGPGVDNVQDLLFQGLNITGGTFTISFNGQPAQTVAWSNNVATLVSNIQNAMNVMTEALGFPAGTAQVATYTTNNSVGIGVERDGLLSPPNPSVTFTNLLGSQPIADIIPDDTRLAGTGVSISVTTTTPGNNPTNLGPNPALPAPGAPNTNAVQTLVFGGTITGGTFTLTLTTPFTPAGAVTAPITWSSDPTTLVNNIQAALDAILPAGSTSVSQPLSNLFSTGEVAEIGSPAGITKLGSQRLTLEGNGVNTGETIVQVGALQIANDTALGSGVGGTVVDTGASLELAPVLSDNNGGISEGLQVWGNNLTLNGTGNSTYNEGALTILGADDVWRGDITLNSTISVTFQGGELQGVAVPVMTANTAALTAGPGSIPAVTVATATPGGTGVNAVQTLSFGGNITGGSFILNLYENGPNDTLVAVPTAPIQWTANPAVLVSRIQAALNVLASQFGTLSPGFVLVALLSPVIDVVANSRLTVAGVIQDPTAESPLVITGTATTGTPTITALPTTAYLSVGLGVSGTGIPAGTTIAAINSATSITLSVNATADVTGQLTFSNLNAADLVVQGGGELQLTATNTYSGTTYVNQGILTIANNEALGNTGVAGTQSLSFTGAVPQVTTFTLAFNGAITPAILYTGTDADATAIAAALNALPTIGGVIGGSVIVTPGDPGVFLITFGGNLTGISSPLLNVQVTSAAGLGTAVVGAEGGTEVANGAQLQLNAGVAVAGEPLIVQGTGSQSEILGINLNLFTLTGNTVNGSNIVSALAPANANIFVGQPLSGAGIPPGATVASIISPTRITISEPAIGTGATSLTFYPLTYNLTYNGATTSTPIAFTGNTATDMAAIQNALNALPSITGVKGSVTVTQTATPNVYDVTLGGSFAGVNQTTNVDVTPALPLDAVASVPPAQPACTGPVSPAITTVQPGFGAASEVQYMSISGAGSFYLTYDGAKTIALSGTSSATDLSNALNALPTIGGVGGFVTVNATNNPATLTLSNQQTPTDRRHDV